MVLKLIQAGDRESTLIHLAVCHAQSLLEATGDPTQHLNRLPAARRDGQGSWERKKRREAAWKFVNGQPTYSPPLVQRTNGDWMKLFVSYLMILHGTGRSDTG